MMKLFAPAQRRFFVVFFLLALGMSPAHAGKVTDYPSGGTVQAADVFYCIRGTTDYKCTGTNLSTYVLAADSEIAALAGLTSAADKCVVFSGAGTAITFDCTSFGRGLLGVANEAALKTLINAEAGVDFQAYDADLITYAGITPSANVQSLLGAADYSAMRTQLGLGTGDSPQFTGINLGHASDTTITRVSAGVIAVEGSDVVVSGGALGTPASGTLTNATGLPVSTGVSGLGANVATFLATPSGANLASALTTALPASDGGTGTAGRSGESFFGYAEVQISSAEVLALNATPKQIVAAQGANTLIVVDYAVVFYDYQTTAYAGIGASEDLALKYNNASGSTVCAVELTGFADQTSDKYELCMGQSQTAISTITPQFNAAIVANISIGEITTGDAPLYIGIWYHVVSVSDLGP